MTFETWLQGWLTRHPPSQRTDAERARFTEQVMARVTSGDRPSPSPKPLRIPWLPWVLVAATATAAVAIVWHNPSHRSQMAKPPTLEAQAPLAVSDTPLMAQQDILPRKPERGAKPSGPILLAQELSEDEAWLDETLRLLEELDEEVSDETTGGDELYDDEEWLDDLEMFDGNELAASAS